MSLKIERLASLRQPPFTVRYPRELESQARSAVEMLESTLAVVETYLGADFEGRIQLDLLAEARRSGVNPASGIIRHALRGFSERSPRTAGLLSYQLGKVHWYRCARDAGYLGAGARHPDWLLDAALLPLMFVWQGGYAWTDYLAAQIELLTRTRAVSSEALSDFSRLSPRDYTVAVAQSALRGQSLAQRHPSWVRDLRDYLSRHPESSGLDAVEACTTTPLATWEGLFRQDISAWQRSTLDLYETV